MNEKFIKCHQQLECLPKGDRNFAITIVPNANPNKPTIHIIGNSKYDSSGRYRLLDKSEVERLFLAFVEKATPVIHKHFPNSFHHFVCDPYSDFVIAYDIKE